MTKITKNTIYLADTNLGNICMTLKDFTSVYSGYALVVTKDKNNPQLSSTALTVKKMKSIIGTGVPKGYKSIYAPAKSKTLPCIYISTISRFMSQVTGLTLQRADIILLHLP